MVCAAALAVFVSPAFGFADPSEATFERSDRFTNRDLLEQSEQLLDRIMNAEARSVVPVYERRLSALEARKLELAEKSRTDYRRFPTF